MTRRAFCPLMTTFADLPRLAQQARNGGNSNKSVSSSKSKAVRRLQVLDLLADPADLPGTVSVGLQDVSRPLPDVAQLMQLPAHGPIRPRAAVPPGQVLLEQLDGPFRIAIAPISRWSFQGRAQHGEEIVVPGGDMTMPPGIAEGAGRGCEEVAIEPVVDRLSRDAQLGSDGSDREPLIELQEGQGPTKDVGVVGGVASPSQAIPLLGCEVEVHRTLPGRLGWIGVEEPISSSHVDANSTRRKNP